MNKEQLISLISCHKEQFDLDGDWVMHPKFLLPDGVGSGQEMAPGWRLNQATGNWEFWVVEKSGDFVNVFKNGEVLYKISWFEIKGRISMH